MARENTILHLVILVFISIEIMSNDSPFSKSQLDLLKQMKKQITSAHVQQQIKKVQQATAQVEQDVEDEMALFHKQMQGVQKIDNGNTIAIEKPRKKKLDAQTLAKRAAAMGPMQTDETVMSDTQAMLNPVGSQASLNYRIATLQHKVFEDLKVGNLRWFEAVDLHGCTIEEARQAVLQIIQIAKEENQNVIKIVHGKGPEAILKTYVNSWLRQHRDVLAFVSAPEKQGGTGAVLVLLKRTEKNPQFKQ